MKLEVGKFIRTPYGIRKIVNITKDDGYGKPRVKVIELDDFLNIGYKFNYKFYTDEKIIKECKASYNIIDILEKGDYVNSKEVIEIYQAGNKFKGSSMYSFREKTIELDNDNYETIPQDCLLTNEDIKSVITHEQMEQISYEVGE